MSATRTKKRAKRPRRRRKAPARLEFGQDELLAIVERAKSARLSSEDVEALSAVINTLTFVTEELEHKGVTIARLRKLLFGSSSEKSKDVLAEQAEEGQDAQSRGEGENAVGRDDRHCGDTKGEADIEPDATGEADIEPEGEGDVGEADGGSDGDASEDKRKDKRKGHGRRGADTYTGAEQVQCDHESLAHGQRCPSCERGKLYRQNKPATLVRVRGVAPLSATRYDLERLRCNLCGEVFTAQPPPGVGKRKYDETAAAMIALLKYGVGLPFNRLERLGAELGIPLPSGTQWEVIKAAAVAFEPVWAELIREAAEGDVLYIDDTSARVLALSEQIREELRKGQTERRGIFTSGVVSTVEGRELVLFFTSRKHAGENLAEVLAQRTPERAAPIQMCDALSRNTSGDFDTIVGSCMAHARRHFVDVVHNFPDEVAHVLETLREVYVHDAEARAQAMSPDERLLHHQEHSAPLMEALDVWLQEHFDERKVEPNSSLGGAMNYMHNHWDKLTLFLRVPGAPLDNNICERAIKRAILHRKNSLFYKTENGARIGDLFMSLILTAERNGQNPFEYLVAIQKHADAVREHPERWMPWNYVQTQALLGVATQTSEHGDPH